MKSSRGYRRSTFPFGCLERMAAARPGAPRVGSRDLTLADHREDLIAAYDLSRRAHRLEAEARANQSFDPSMVLLDNIIEVFDLLQTCEVKQSMTLHSVMAISPRSSRKDDWNGKRPPAMAAARSRKPRWVDTNGLLARNFGRGPLLVNGPKPPSASRF